MQKGVDVLEPPTPRGAPDDFVEFFSAGVAVKGEFHCSQCGYGVAVHNELPRCPMCGGESWEQTPWSPFTRERQPL